MKETGNDSVRIVVKKGKGHGAGHHGGAWKVAYADFVTAMMALFIVLWIVGQSKSIKESVSQYFKDPGAFSETTRSGGVLPGSAQPEMISQKIEKKLPVEEPQREIERLRAEGKKIEGIISAAPAFEKFKDRVKVSVSDEGLRIELIENSIGLFFDVGSANLKADTISLLRLVAAELGSLSNPVIIEGYTDARPFGTENYTNWELSTDRANKARKILEENGLRPGQVVEVRGFADRRLNIPQDPLDASNRRISLFLTPVSDSSTRGREENRDPRNIK
jgi:chemotaxis protein MotB